MLSMRPNGFVDVVDVVGMTRLEIADLPESELVSPAQLSKEAITVC